MLKRMALALAIVAATLVLGMIGGCAKTVEKSPEPKPVQEAPKAPKAQEPPGKNQQAKPAALKPGQYFPLAKGTAWQYQGEGNEYASFTREVIFTGGNRAQIREDNGGTVMAFVFETTEEAVVRVFSQGEVYDRINLLDRSSGEKVVILKSPLQPGTKWKDPNGEREIMDVNATVNTPAGKFEKCIKVRITGQHSTIFEYFKDGVGMVKREFISGETRVTSTLEKYTPGKG